MRFILVLVNVICNYYLGDSVGQGFLLSVNAGHTGHVDNVSLGFT